MGTGVFPPRCRLAIYPNSSVSQLFLVLYPSHLHWSVRLLLRSKYPNHSLFLEMEEVRSRRWLSIAKMAKVFASSPYHFAVLCDYIP